MKRFRAAIRRPLIEEDGATFAEYALVVGLIAVVCVLSVTNLGQGALSLLVSACNTVSTAISGVPLC